MNCSVGRCTRKSTKKGKCSKHWLRDWRSKNPIKYAYQTLKDNAKRRGKKFDLTLDEFERFAVTTKYMIGKGRTSDSLHVDRIDETKGYTVDNLQVLTNVDNLKKYLRWSIDERGKPYYFINEIIREKKNEYTLLICNFKQ